MQDEGTFEVMQLARGPEFDGLGLALDEEVIVLGCDGLPVHADEMNFDKVRRELSA